MATIKIKTSKPFIEREVKAKGLSDKITIGITAYPISETKALIKEFRKLANNIKTSKSLKELETIKDNVDLSEDEVELKTEELTDLIDNLTTEQQKQLDTFYKKHVLFLKDIALLVEENGIDKTITITDTREATPIESLWNTPGECLVVLLDLYLDNVFFRDSLTNTITSAIFNIDFKGEELKN